MHDHSRRRWLIAAAIGCGLIALTMLVALLVLVDKKHFGDWVGSYFLQTIAGGMMIGALLVLVAALRIPERWTWRRIVLLAWALIAITSPLFGFLFLVPWAVLALMLPLVIAILVGLFKVPVRDTLTP